MDLKRIKSNLENNKVISFKAPILFAFFQMIMLWIFDVYSFFEFQDKASFFYIEVFLIVFIIHFINSFIINRLKLKDRITNIYLSVSFVISSIFSSILCWWISEGSFSILLIVISSFIIPSLFPALGTFLKLIFEDAKATSDSLTKSNAINQNEEDKKSIIQPIANQEIIENIIIEKPIQFVLENENGKILLDIPIKNIICFEANDNYVVTYYLDREERLKKSMERISLKKIEEIVEGLNVDNFTRVHKSYLINKSFLEEIKGKAQAHKLKLYHLELLIPVSRAYPINKLKEF
jgi:hypothetical protein